MHDVYFMHDSTSWHGELITPDEPADLALQETVGDEEATVAPISPLLPYPPMRASSRT